MIIQSNYFSCESHLVSPSYLLTVCISFSLILLSVLIAQGGDSWLPNMERFSWVQGFSSITDPLLLMLLLFSSLSILPSLSTLSSFLNPFPFSSAPEPARVTVVKCGQHNTSLPIAIIVHVGVCENTICVCLFKCLCLRIHLRPN